MSKPTDEEILIALGGSRKVTAHIANIAFGFGRPIDVSHVRRRLMAMEKSGLVRRTQGVYKSQITWESCHD